ncbi:MULTISPECIES: RNA polymerase sigma factor [Chitinophagaceae]
MTTDQQIFQSTIFIHKDKMFRFAKSMLNSETEAFDIVQDVMVKLWQNRNALFKLDNAEAYMMRSVKNECLDRHRHGKVVARFNAAQKPDIVIEPVHRQTKEVILKLIGQLPEKQKLVMHLRDVEEYEISEIAALLDMEDGTVRVNLMRGRQKIKSQLEKIWAYEQRQIGR